jgi:glycosyltransferase involved in cell wall biosynthesis
MGEYARSLAIAHAARRQWPQSSVHFVLSRQAPYAASVPYPKTLLDSSATFHSAAVASLIEKFKPHLVIFDNAGRTAQLRAARGSGARVVYISSRARQRRKAFRLSWMRLLDEHWIAYPKFIAGDLGILEQFKLNLLKRPAVRYLDVIFARGGESREAILARAGLKYGEYVLLVPGGGTGHPGAADASSTFLAAAKSLAQRGVPTVLVGAKGAGEGQGRLQVLNSLPQETLAKLMQAARLVISNGGSTLLQAIACGVACIAVPIAKDQPERIRRCVQAQVARPAALDAASIVNAAGELLSDDAARLSLAHRASDLKLADGVEVAMAALVRLMRAG